MYASPRRTQSLIKKQQHSDRWRNYALEPKHGPAKRLFRSDEWTLWSNNRLVTYFPRLNLDWKPSPTLNREVFLFKLFLFVRPVLSRSNFSTVSSCASVYL